MKVELYTVDYCPYCKKALAFLKEHNVKFENHDITEVEEEWRENFAAEYNMYDRVTVPQIFIDGNRIGGYTDMMELYNSGELNFN